MSLSGRVRGSGQLEPLRFDARLDAVRGSLRGWPLSADGRIALGDDGLSTDGLVIRHGESELELTGGMQQPGGVSFEAQVADLGHYLDGVSGDLKASGRLTELDGEPALAAEVSSRRLGVDDAELLDTTLRIDATPAFQAVELRSMLEDQQLEFTAEGALDNPGAPTSWDGALTGFSLRQKGEEEQGEIHLVEPAALRVTRDSLSLSRACLQGSIEARLCLELNWVANARLEVLADLDSIAVDRVNQFFDTGFAFDQLVTGQMRWDKRADRPLAASAQLSISPGSIRNVGRDDLVVRTGEGELSFEVRDGALLQGEMHLPLPETGKVDGAFSIADISNLDDSAIDGHVDAVLNDLSVLRVLLPTVDQADGRLEAKVDVGGTAGAPVLTGNIALDDGVLEYRPIGLRLEDIELEAAFDEARHFDLAGEFRAGDGQGTLRSSGSYGSGIREDLVVLLQGRDLRLIDVPDLQATANTDVRIGFDDGVIRLDGSVLVPHARISPRSLPATRHSESQDVVIVAGELPVERAEEERSAIVLDGKLEVGLGDDVVVDIDLAEASVTGTVTFEWDRNLIPVANGRYEIAGDVQAYGQVLTITEGTIRFPNVASQQSQPSNSRGARDLWQFADQDGRNTRRRHGQAPYRRTVHGAAHDTRAGPDAARHGQRLRHGTGHRRHRLRHLHCAATVRQLRGRPVRSGKCDQCALRRRQGFRPEGYVRAKGVRRRRDLSCRTLSACAKRPTAARRAATRLAGRIRETPLDHSPRFSERTGAEVYFKLENLQITGSFKLRGAFNRLLMLDDASRRAGAVAASSGNHGAAVAYAMRALGIPGVVFVPAHTSPVKIAAIRAAGGDVRFFGTDGLDTELHAREHARRLGMVYVSPYNDAEVIAGQGSCGVEILRQLPDVDTAFIAVGGGGLVSGVGSVLKTAGHEVRVYGCQPRNSPVMSASVDAGRVLELDSLPTLSDGTAGGVESDSITFDLCRAVVDRFVLVDEAAIAGAMREYMDAEHQLIEGAAGVAIAALLEEAAALAGRKVVVLVCGANISREMLARVIC